MIQYANYHIVAIQINEGDLYALFPFPVNFLSIKFDDVA